MRLELIALLCCLMGVAHATGSGVRRIGTSASQIERMRELAREALDELEGCRPLRDLMGARFVRAYVSVKRKEYETFFRVISSWEREFLLLNV